jgi:hypothetical protein
MNEKRNSLYVEGVMAYTENPKESMYVFRINKIIFQTTEN